VSEVSVARARTAPGKGWARGTVATRAALVAAKVVSMAGVQGGSWGYLRVRELAKCAGNAWEEREIHHTQESLQSFAVGWFRKIQNDLDIVPDAVAQKIQLGDSEHALLHVEGQAVGGEDGEQRAEVGPVLLSGFVEDPVIILKGKHIF
jgi:hypothetical protein